MHFKIKQNTPINQKCNKFFKGKKITKCLGIIPKTQKYPFRIAIIKNNNFVITLSKNINFLQKPLDFMTSDMQCYQTVKYLTAFSSNNGKL